MKAILLITLLSALSACASTSPGTFNDRNPAGTGDIGSSDGSFSALSSYKLPITRSGKEVRRLAVNTWQGEYPGPIIDVNGKNSSGTTMIKGFKSLRKLTDAVSCTIKNGVYHPWSNELGSLEDFWTLLATEDYEVIKDVRVSNEIFEGSNQTSKTTLLPKGSKIINLYGVAENYCGATLKIRHQLRALSFNCDMISDKKIYKKITNDSDFREQWVSLICQEKNPDNTFVRVFLKDEDLLKQTGSIEGQMCHYGHVRAKGVDCPPEPAEFR